MERLITSSQRKAWQPLAATVTCAMASFSPDSIERVVGLGRLYSLLPTQAKSNHGGEGP